MFVAPLGSGSAGNASLFESDGTSILIDAGFGPREIDKRLKSVGSSIERLNAIVLTHEHYDHIRGAGKISEKYGIPIYLTAGTLGSSSLDRKKTSLVVFENNSSFRIGDLLIHAQRTVHDAGDPACFVVEAGDGTRVGLATDLGCVEGATLEHLSNCDALLFEANHDLDMLRAGTYPWSLKRRIMSRYGHLSNDDSMNALQRLIGRDTKALCMIHLSKKNNHESIVKSMASELISRTAAKIDLHIALQDQPLGMLTIARRTSPRAQRPVQLSLF